MLGFINSGKGLVAQILRGNVIIIGEDDLFLLRFIDAIKAESQSFFEFFFWTSTHNQIFW